MFKSLFALFALIISVAAQDIAARGAAQTCATTSELRAIATTEKWALTYLALANIAYANGTKDQNWDAQNSIPRIVKALPSPQCGNGDTVDNAAFSVPFGPVMTTDGSNLLYIAKYQNNAGEVIFYSVTIRGTQGGTETLALVQQILQDLNSVQRVRWDLIGGNTDLRTVNCDVGTDGPEASIAKGTCNGMTKMLGLTTIPTGYSKPVNVYQFLSNELALDSNVPVIVTGHSLGGTQTEAIAMYLKSVLRSGTIVSAQPFAPASAGNVAFAEIWDRQIGQVSYLWANTLDIVPYGYENVSAVLSMYSVRPYLFPSSLVPTVTKFINYLDSQGKPYKQPGRNQFWMYGNLVFTDPRIIAWSDQVGAQHFPPMYFKLMCANFVYGDEPTVFDYKFQGLASNAGWANCEAALQGVLPDPPALTFGKHGPVCHTKAASKAKCCCAPNVTKTVTVKRTKVTTKKTSATKKARAESVGKRDVTGQHLCPKCSSMKPSQVGKACCDKRVTRTVYKTIS